MFKPHQKNLRAGRHSAKGRAYSLTKCAAEGIRLTDDSTIAAIIIDTFFWMELQGRFHLGPFVIMPDHYHLVIKLNAAGTLAGIMKSIGSFTARRISRFTGRSEQIWQRGYYERAIRESEDFLSIAEYIHHNPVRKELIMKAEQWPYSSSNEKYYRTIEWRLFV